MSKPIIDKDECVGCGICVDTCPTGVLEVEDGISVAVNADDCIGCKACEEACPMDAIVVEE